MAIRQCRLAMSAPRDPLAIPPSPPAGYLRRIARRGPSPRPLPVGYPRETLTGACPHHSCGRSVQDGAPFPSLPYSRLTAGRVYLEKPQTHGSTRPAAAPDPCTSSPPTAAGRAGFSGTSTFCAETSRALRIARAHTAHAPNGPRRTRQQLSRRGDLTPWVGIFFESKRLVYAP